MLKATVKYRPSYAQLQVLSSKSEVGRIQTAILQALLIVPYPLCTCYFCTPVVHIWCGLCRPNFQVPYPSHGVPNPSHWCHTPVTECHTPVTGAIPPCSHRVPYPQSQSFIPPVTEFYIPQSLSVLSQSQSALPYEPHHIERDLSAFLAKLSQLQHMKGIL